MRAKITIYVQVPVGAYPGHYGTHKLVSIRQYLFCIVTVKWQYN